MDLMHERRPVTEPAQRLVDIHCHVLPELDDGASCWNEAFDMARMAVAEGIACIVATPHQLGSFSNNHGARIREQVDRFQQALDERQIPLRVLPGADVRIEPELVAKVRSGDVVSLADRRRHVLLELPHEVYVPLDRLLAEFDAAGMVAVLSHPERNLGILSRPAVVSHLIDRGCLLQITAGSLLGAFGMRIQRFAESLVAQGVVHFVATDAHGTRSRPPRLGKAFHRVAELAGRDAAVRLCCLNPGRVADGGEVACGRTLPRRAGWISWLCHPYGRSMSSPANSMG